jgi:hypothetical protein
VLAGIVLIGLVLYYLISATFSGDDGNSGGQSTASPTVDPTVTTSPAPGSTVAACGPGDIEVTTTATGAGGSKDFSAGTLPVFTVQITHTGAAPCSLTTPSSDTELIITSGTDRIFSSADCADDPTVPARELILVDGATESLELTWNRQRSLPECAEITAEPGVGTYKAAFTLQGVPSSPELETFTLSE